MVSSVVRAVITPVAIIVPASGSMNENRTAMPSAWPKCRVMPSVTDTDETRSPLRKTPLVLASSTTTHCAPTDSILACVREMRVSSMRSCAGSSLPMNTGPSPGRSTSSTLPNRTIMMGRPISSRGDCEGSIPRF